MAECQELAGNDSSFTPCRQRWAGAHGGRVGYSGRNDGQHREEEDADVRHRGGGMECESNRCLGVN